jgi:hypothetical protein
METVSVAIITPVTAAAMKRPPRTFLRSNWLPIRVSYLSPASTGSKVRLCERTDQSALSIRETSLRASRLRGRQVRVGC